jgi:LCP family protein required for cell wall assembly
VRLASTGAARGEEKSVTSPYQALGGGPGGSRPHWWRGFLSAIVPGLGQLVGGRMRTGLLFLSPILILLLAALVAMIVNGPLTVAAWFADPGVLAGLLIVEAAILVWRILAVVSSLELPGVRWRPMDIVPAAVLAIVVMAPQLMVGTVTAVARQTSDRIFSGGSGGATGVWVPSAAPSAHPSASAAPASSSGASAAASTRPSSSPVPTVAGGRITVLLLGVDRSLDLTDTMIVASVDTVAKTVSMLSIPRDTVDIPLPNGTIYRGKLNSLMYDASRNPARYPGSNGDGHAVLVAAVSTLIGQPIQYWAQLDFDGLQKLVDAVGGVDVTVPTPICDTTFREYGWNGWSIAAGRFHLNGLQALTYARIRKAPGESDFTRAKRQQDVILAIRTAALRGGLLHDPIGVIQALGDTLLTNVPPSILPAVVGLADQVGPSRSYRMTLIPPRSVTQTSDSRGFILEPNVERIRSLAAQLFPPAGQTPVATAADTLPAADTSTTTGTAPTVAPNCPVKTMH